jgi:acetylornithine aminotransferase/acetylornithine/N-succinyldiaminopimelate aminotransferase
MTEAEIAKKIKDIRGRGFLIGVEMETEQDAASVKAKMRDQGILVNVCHGKTVRIMPPLIFSKDQEKEWMQAFESCL